MKAVVFHGNGKWSLEEREIPKIASSNETLIKVQAASICGSDMHIISVPPGQIANEGVVIGHEFCGEIVDVGSGVKKFKPGDRVIIEPVFKCGMCDACRSGLENLCTGDEVVGFSRDGAFAEYCVIPQKYLYKIPDSVPYDLASLTEPLACVMNGILKLKPMAHEKAVLYGAGAIGLIFLRVLKYYGLRDVIVCEPNPDRREEALRLGASMVIDNIHEDPKEIFLKEYGTLPEIAIEAVGVGAVTEQAISVVKIGGRLLLFGQNSTQTATIKPVDIQSRELTLIGTLSTRDSFNPAIELIKNPELRLNEIISHHLPLDRISEGFDLMKQGKCKKIIILPREK